MGEQLDEIMTEIDLQHQRTSPEVKLKIEKDKRTASLELPVEHGRCWPSIDMRGKGFGLYTWVYFTHEREHSDHFDSLVGELSEHPGWEAPMTHRRRTALGRHTDYARVARFGRWWNHQQLEEDHEQIVRAVVAQFARMLTVTASFLRSRPSSAPDFQGRVARALRDAPEARRSRLLAANPIPKRTEVTVTRFERNPDVVAECLSRANGRCEICNEPAPFLRLSDGSPYLEVHHKQPLAIGGPDTVANAVAVCPNCHRREHLGEARYP